MADSEIPSKPDPAEQDRTYKRPEFVIIDDTNEYLHGQSNPELDPDFGEQESAKHVWAFRIFCIFAVIFSCIFSILIFFYLLFIFSFAALLLFQSESLNQNLSSAWRMFKNSIVVTVSLAIGLFSPTLGMGLLILYFSLKGENQVPNRLKTVMNRFL